MGRNKSIDGLRGITMLLLVVFHLFYSYLENFEGQQLSFLLINRWGVIGYTVFLFISGYYIEKSSKSGIEFITSKILRLWPTYFFGITVLFVVSCFLPLPDRTIGFGEYILNVFWVNHLVGATYVDTAHWYLSTLVGCSIVFSVIKYIQSKIIEKTVRKIKNRNGQPQDLADNSQNKDHIMCVDEALFRQSLKVYGGYLYFAYALSILLFFILAKYSNKTLVSVIFGIIGGRYATLLLWGVILSYALDNGIKKLSTVVLIGTNSITTVLILGVQYLIVVAFAAFIVGFLLKYDLRFMHNKVFLWLGEISFSTYIVHAYMGFTLIYYISRLVGEYHFYISGVVVVLMVLYGWGTYLFIEKPSAKLIQRLVRNRFITQK